MSDTLGAVSHYEILNLYARFGIRSVYPCACCLGNFAASKPVTFGRAGCFLLPIDNEEVRRAFAPYRIVDAEGNEVQVMRCLRCILHSRHCFALPEDCPIDLQEVHKHVKDVQKAFNQLDKDVPEGQAMSREEEYDLACLRLSRVCKHPNDSLNGIGSHSNNLFLTGTGLVEGDPPHSGVRLQGLGKSKKAREIKRRAEEIEIAEGVEQQAKRARGGGDARKKEVVAPNPRVSKLNTDIQAAERRLAAARSEQASARKGSKKTANAAVKKAETELDKLREELRSLQ